MISCARLGLLLSALLISPALAQNVPASVAADHERARVLNNSAAGLANAGNTEVALKLYGRVIALNPNAGVYYNNRASAREKTGDASGALADYDVAVRLEPKAAVFYSNRAGLLLNKGDGERALADYDRAVSLEPKTGFFRQQRANAHVRQKDLKAAIRDFEAAFRLDPKLTAAREMAKVLRDMPAPKQKLAPATGPALRRVALVIGNGDYGKLGKLANPKRDAAAIAAALRAVGFESVEVIEDAGHDRMVQALDTFAGKAAEAEWAVVYYAGHGLEAGGINYLIPVDAELADTAELQDRAVPLDRVLSSIQRAGKLRLVLLDACREDPGFARLKRTVATRSVSRGLAPVPGEAGRRNARRLRGKARRDRGRRNGRQQPLCIRAREVPRPAGARDQQALPPGTRRGDVEHPRRPGALHLRLPVRRRPVLQAGGLSPACVLSPALGPSPCQGGRPTCGRATWP